MSQASSFRSRPPPESGLIKAAFQGGVFLSQPLHIDQHGSSIARTTEMGQLFMRDALRDMSPIKSVGINAALWVAEIESAREGVGANGQPVHQIGRGFHNHR